MKIIAIAFLALLLVVGWTSAISANPPAHAGGNGVENGKRGDFKPGKGAKHEKAEKAEKSEKPAKTSGKRNTENDLIYATITAFAARELAVQGGWTGYKPLPPGIAKKLARGKPLPPGIAKKTIPGNMLRKLPAYPGYTWYTAGKDLLLISTATMVIADVLQDVFD